MYVFIILLTVTEFHLIFICLWNAIFNIYLDQYFKITHTKIDLFIYFFFFSNKNYDKFRTEQNKTKRYTTTAKKKWKKEKKNQM